MRIAAFDLAITNHGYATGPDDHGRLTSRGKGGVRLAHTLDLVAGIARDADLVLVEGYAYAKSNQAHQMGEARGPVLLWLWRIGKPHIIVPPAVLKKYATGSGGASKDRVMAEAIRRLGYGGESKDVADALWLWFMAADWYGLVGSPVPKAQRAVLDRITWPKMEG